MKSKYITFILMTISLKSYAGLWTWEGVGATKWLNGYPECGCYFSLQFSDKVTPKSAAHFDYQDISYQIVSLPKTDFLSDHSKTENEKLILESHLKYELGYLKKSSKNYDVKIKHQEWIKDQGLLYWNLIRKNNKESSQLVTLSMVSDKCVFYITSMVKDDNQVAESKAHILKIMNTLNIHVPTSKDEFEALISEFKPS
ncbi:hypothetical protein L1077_05350 [Pseudoalteromonas luteoviolacea]|uniref:hypothetical protein n=1 Tax=Pseudoalteromonas luteoviolacea TaxID=43657 RepID=UPI001F242CE0|nr:hypothetical protein [Pseudoalteromonas luteoviolacea]MCF6438856.1 hypothetical protein [Pseudoalteromonas luteoviolacea]